VAYGKRLLTGQLKELMKDPKASISQKIQIAKLIAEINDYTKPKQPNLKGLGKK
jgi:hypothetical protein